MSRTSTHFVPKRQSWLLKQFVWPRFAVKFSQAEQIWCRLRTQVKPRAEPNRTEPNRTVQASRRRLNRWRWTMSSAYEPAKTLCAYWGLLLQEYHAKDVKRLWSRQQN